MPLDPTNPSDPALAPARQNILRRVVVVAVFSYAISLTLLFLVMELIGERWWPIAILLYLPQRIFLLPIIVLFPAALLADASISTFTVLTASVIIFLWHDPFYLGMSGASGPIKIKVVTNNYGQNHHLPIQPFIKAEEPDFVGLDDSPGQGPGFERAFPDRDVRAVGQFVFISKARVTSATSLDWPRWRGGPIAAVFEVPWQGENLAIYTVHLPTPRGDFAKLAGLGLLRELAGHNRRRSDNMSFAEAMTARVQLARDLASVFAREKRPFIAMGDFNMPSDGYVNHVITWGLLDCFAQAGRGFGFTFPCDTDNPLTLGGPWLRLDYVLAGPGWRASDCRVEPGRRSQHRAVVATLSRD